MPSSPSHTIALAAAAGGGEEGVVVISSSPPVFPALRFRYDGYDEEVGSAFAGGEEEIAEPEETSTHWSVTPPLSGEAKSLDERTTILVHPHQQQQLPQRQVASTSSCSSSPGLLSPRAFMRFTPHLLPPAPPHCVPKALKSGSKATPVPEEAEAKGFMPVGGLWRSKYFDNEVKDDVEVDDKEAETRKRAGGGGKLVKPTKRKAREVGGDDGMLLLREKSPSVGPGGVKGKGKGDAAALKEVKRRTKRSAKVDLANGETATKKRKRKKKSESLIVNSDDLDPVAENPMAIPQEAHLHGPEAAVNSVQEAAVNTATMATESVQPDCVEDQTSPHFTTTEPQAPTNDDLHPVEDDSVQLLETTIIASRRRKSWTPVKDTAPNDLSAEQAPAETETTPVRPQLAAILGGFEFVPLAEDREQTPSIGLEAAATKKRRIELEHSSVKTASTSKVALKLLPKAAKRAKGPKKAQTITALATAGYQKQKEGEPDAPIQGPATEAESTDQIVLDTWYQVQLIPEKSTKRRKTRDDADGPDTKSTKKRKQGRAKEVHNPLPLLYSPSRATACMNQQTFLFGTSSQLAIDESPSFIRDMQTAIHESEINHSIQTDDLQRTVGLRKGQGCVSVPSAPHGTSLSVGQTDRELWRVAARGRDGGLFRHKRLLPPPSKPDSVGCEVAPNGELAGAEHGPLTLRSGIEKQTLHLSATLPEGTTPLILSSPVEVVSVQPAARLDTEPRMDLPQVESLASKDDPVNLPPIIATDDSWFLLRSDSPQSQVCVITSRNQPATLDRPRSGSLDKPFAHLARNSPSPTRSPLRSLDANASMFALTSTVQHASPLGQVRGISTTAPAEARTNTPIKRPRGRPRKDSNAESTDTVQPPAKRGRPRKDSSAASVVPEKPPAKRGRPRKDDSTNPAISAQSPARRGRPPKVAVPPDGGLLTPRKPTKSGKVTKKRSNAPETTEWLNIDEISDSDAPKTPSPPRRRIGSLSPAMQPLDLLPAVSAALDMPGTIPSMAANTVLKPTDASWLSIAPDLFPRITTMVKSDTGSKGSEEIPSWWDKILLYDPIVIEDLTEWLNAQGLRFAIQRPKLKARKKGRKKKVDGDDSNTATGAANEDECELHEEEVKPWMVQKWCEDNSICCLWKGSGRRHVIRGRY